MQWDRREQEIRYYQDRINQLEHENMMLRGYTTYQPYQQDPVNNSVIQLATRNEKLERETDLYQQEIKRQLTDFIHESNMLRECNFKRKYVNALAYPPPKHFGYRKW